VPWWRGPLDKIVHAPGRGGRFRRILTNLGSFERGSLEREAENILRSRGDPVALLRVLDIPVDTPPKRSPESRHPHSWLAGTHDGDHNTADALAAAIAAEPRISPSRS
jgi:hypothetical protein